MYSIAKLTIFSIKLISDQNIRNHIRIVHLPGDTANGYWTNLELYLLAIEPKKLKSTLDWNEK